MAPLHSTSSLTALDKSREDAQPAKDLEPNQNVPPPQAFAFAHNDKSEPSTDDDTIYDSSREEETEEDVSVLMRKLCRYKRRNKELSEDYKEQQVALLGLQHEYTLLKLELAEAQSNRDGNDMAKDEAIASKDLKILELVKERDDLTHQVRELKRVEARLENSIHKKDSRLVGLVEERDSMEEELRFTVKERDNVMRQLESLGKASGVPEDGSNGRWRKSRGLLRRACFVPRAKPHNPVDRIVPVDAIVTESIHSR